jgi:peroxiredoxin
VALAFGACDSKDDAYPRRTTFVVGGDGKLEQVIDTKDPGGQAEALLAALGG